VIVAGVDGSDSSWRATAFAVGLARRQDALLVLVHVLPPHPAAAMAGAAWLLDESDRAAADEMGRRVAAGLAGTAGTASLRWEFHTLAAADVVVGLARMADALRADTVVVGSSRGLRHRLFGSAGVKLVRIGRWPVVVVP
jgi:nucleotide-binding universal stress UspA family protein